jgi:hypothetical protein
MSSPEGGPGAPNYGSTQEGGTGHPGPPYSSSGYPQPAYPPVAYPQSAATGTPLGRIVLGVFLGFSLALIAWTAVVAVLVAILTATLVSTFRDAVDDIENTEPSSTSSPSSDFNLSQACRDALDQDFDIKAVECQGADYGDIADYLESKGQ